MDVQKVISLRDGDRQVFREVFDSFWDKVYSYLAKKTRCTETAKDLTQLVFIRLWKYRHSLSAEIGLNEQLFRKTKQVFIDWLRQEYRKRKRIAESGVPGPVVFDPHDTGFEIKSDVSNALRALPPKRKEVFELRHIYGYSYKEIAELLGISVKTVDNQLLKANLQLRKLLRISIYTAISSELIRQIQ